MKTSLFELGLSFFIGIITSGISFFMTMRLGRSRIELSEVILHQDLYRAKILNKARWRSVYDISIYVHYRFTDGTFFLAPRKYIPILTRMPRKTAVDARKEIGPYEMYIHIGDAERNDKTKIVPLEDFFCKQDKGIDPYIDIVVICYSKLGGGIRYVTTRRYFKENIKDNCQFEKNSTDIVEIDNIGCIGMK